MLLCHHVISPALFMLVGLGAYVRNFNALHEASHARRSPWNPLRRIHMAVMIVHTPFQLGYRELARNHRLHHAFPRDLDHDPDASLNSGQWYTAAPYASVQPELSAWQYLRRTGAGGLDKGLRRVLAYNCAMTAALIALSGADYLWWIAVTRVGSTAVWFIFDWILHHPRIYPLPSLRPLPRVVRWLWAVMFSRANLNAASYHALHHAYPSVADNELPALARLLAAQAHDDGLDRATT
ncbi:MAG: fatty acid desaturase [Nannocystis sp.]|nr:fatty acid desaturase [Nannocystis sp.]MBA3548444.1 fatty acid desaturase [Nannocystis sp.]